MSHSRLGRSLLRTFTAGLGLLLLGLSAPAPAVATAEGCPPLGIVLGAAPGLIVGQGWEECADASAHDPDSTLVVGLPGDGTSALLTTGTAAHADPGADEPEAGTSWSSSPSHGYATDVSTYRLDVAVPEGHNCLSFDYVVGSDEFGGPTDARDGFVASISSNDWSVGPSGPGAVPELTAPHAFASFTTNSTAATVVPQPNGTSYAGASAVQNAEVGVPPGESRIYLSVYDGGYPGVGSDPAVDTGVFVDNLTTFADEQGCASPVNQLPLATDDGSEAFPLPVTTEVATPLVVTDNDYDPDGNPLTVAVVGNPSHGTALCEPSPIDLNQQVCWYTSTAGYEGLDSFGYRVSDGHGGFDTATVHVVASNEDPRTVEILGASGQPGVTVSAQVRWPNGVGAPGVPTRLLVGPDESALDAVGANTSTDDYGFVSFAPYSTPATGNYFFRVRLVSAPTIHADLTRFVDHDPPTNVVLAGPTTVQAGVEATWTITMTRAGGGQVQAFEGDCLLEAPDAPPFPVPCDTADGQAEFTGTLPLAGDVNLRFEGAGLSAMCFIHVQDDPVAQTGDCSDAPPSPLETLTLARIGTGPVTVGDAVRFTVTATRADDTPFQGTLLCGLAPATAVGCGGPSVGLFNTDAAGHATLCWVPESTGEVTFGIADSVYLDHPSTHQDSEVLQVGAAVGPDVPCSGSPEPVSTLALVGLSGGDIGEPALFTVNANAGSEGPLTCSVTRNGVIQPVTTCSGITAGTGSVQFTPAAPGDYVVTVSSGAVSSAPRTYHAVDPDVPVITPSVTGLALSASRTRVTWPAAPTITGTLAVQGVERAAVPVELWAGTNPAAMVRIGTDYADANGALALIPPAPTAATYYQWRVPSYSAVSLMSRVQVNPRVTIRARKVSGRDRVTGVVTPSRSGAVVRLQRKIGNGAWRTVVQTRTVGSSYSFKVRSVRRPRQFRVVVLPDSGRLGVTSAITRLR